MDTSPPHALPDQPSARSGTPALVGEEHSMTAEPEQTAADGR